MSSHDENDKRVVGLFPRFEARWWKNASSFFAGSSSPPVKRAGTAVQDLVLVFVPSAASRPECRAGSEAVSVPPLTSLSSPFASPLFLLFRPPLLSPFVEETVGYNESIIQIDGLFTLM